MSTNQSKILKQRKQSLNRIIQDTSKNQKIQPQDIDPKQRTVSAHKKAVNIQNENTSSSKRNGKYLVGWGKLPFFNDNHASKQLQTINKNVLSFDMGESHLIFINNKNQAYGMGESTFGQLGFKTTSHTKNYYPNSETAIIQIMSGITIKNVFCTPYASFIEAENHQIYGCGLNSKGQIGVGHHQIVSEFTLIQTISQNLDGNQTIRRKSSKSRIKSLCFLNNQQQSSKSSLKNQKDDCKLNYEIVQKIEVDRNKTLFHQKQFVIKIVGGAFHTIGLTNHGRIFYSGLLYTESSIKREQFSCDFNVLNMDQCGQVVEVKSGLNGFAFMNKEQQLFLMGLFGDNYIYQEPFRIKQKNLIDYSIQDKTIYAINSFGEVFSYNFQSNQSTLKSAKVQIQTKVTNIYSALDYSLILTQDSHQIYGFGDNTHHQISFSNTLKKVSAPTKVDYFLDQNLQPIQLKCSNNFILFLSEQKICHQKKSSLIENKQNVKNCDNDKELINVKIIQLQKQNILLKQMMKKKQNCMESKENQKDKFDIKRSFPNARIFDNSMEIPFEEIKLGDLISEGGYGIIYKGVWRKTTVAVKIFKIDKNNQNNIKDFISECHAMEALRHPNIVMFLGACTVGPQFAIVLEYCEGGTLWSILQKQSNEISWETRKKFALDTAKAMNYLHDRKVPVLHRDLKSLNLLLDHNNRIKLADFGWTKGLQNYMTGKIGTYQWMAPEVISSQRYTQKADVFSFGIILWQIAARDAPYRNIPGAQVAQDVFYKAFRLQIPKKTPKLFSILISRCWDKDPTLRPSFSQIIDELETMRFSQGQT